MTSSPHNLTVRYLLDLALTFRYFAHHHHVSFRFSICDICGEEKIEIILKNRSRYHKVTTHVTSINVRTLVDHLDEWRIASHDSDLLITRHS